MAHLFKNDWIEMNTEIRVIRLEDAVMQLNGDIARVVEILESTLISLRGLESVVRSLAVKVTNLP